jgi:arginase
MTRSRTLRLIGAPLDLGQTLRGVDMGAGALRCAGLSPSLQRLGYTVIDAGNVAMPVRDALPSGDRGHILAAMVQANRAIARAGEEAVRKGQTPVFLGGDHSVSIGSITGVTRVEPCGVIWIDAHADFNTPATSLSGNIHGMALAVLTGGGPRELVDLGRKGPKVDPADVVLVGVRDLDAGERVRLKKSGITVYTMREVDESGINDVMKKAQSVLSRHRRIHVSLDMDAMDPSVAPGVGTPVPGGLSYREAHLIMELLADTGRVASLDIVEINPILDERNQTALFATNLAASLFGDCIL